MGRNYWVTRDHSAQRSLGIGRDSGSRRNKQEAIRGEGLGAGATWRGAGNTHDSERSHWKRGALRGRGAAGERGGPGRCTTARVAGGGGPFLEAARALRPPACRPAPPPAPRPPFRPRPRAPQRPRPHRPHGLLQQRPEPAQHDGGPAPGSRAAAAAAAAELPGAGGDPEARRGRRGPGCPAPPPPPGLAWGRRRGRQRTWPGRATSKGAGVGGAGSRGSGGAGSSPPGPLGEPGGSERTTLREGRVEPDRFFP